MNAQISWEKAVRDTDRQFAFVEEWRPGGESRAVTLKTVTVWTGDRYKTPRRVTVEVK